MKKKRIRLKWTCSDYLKHEHRTLLGAWWCGQRQRWAWARAVRKLTRSKNLQDLAMAAAKLNQQLHGGKTLTEILEQNVRNSAIPESVQPGIEISREGNE